MKFLFSVFRPSVGESAQSVFLNTLTFIIYRMVLFRVQIFAVSHQTTDLGNVFLCYFSKRFIL